MRERRDHRLLVPCADHPAAVRVLYAGFHGAPLGPGERPLQGLAVGLHDAGVAVDQCGERDRLRGGEREVAAGTVDDLPVLSGTAQPRAVGHASIEDRRKGVRIPGGLPENGWRPARTGSGPGANIEQLAGPFRALFRGTRLVARGLKRQAAMLLFWHCRRFFRHSGHDAPAQGQGLHLRSGRGHYRGRAGRGDRRGRDQGRSGGTARRDERKVCPDRKQAFPDCPSPNPSSTPSWTARRSTSQTRPPERPQGPPATMTKCHARRAGNGAHAKGESMPEARERRRSRVTGL